MNAIRKAVDFCRNDNASPAGFIGPTDAKIMVYRNGTLPQRIKTGDPVYVGDVLESDTESAVNVTVVGMTTLTVGGNGRMVVTNTRAAG